VKQGFFVFMYLLCSLYLIPNDLSVCPTYELLQVLQDVVLTPKHLCIYWYIKNIYSILYFIVNTHLFIPASNNNNSIHCTEVTEIHSTMNQEPT